MNLSLEWSLFVKLKSLDIPCAAFNTGLKTYDERRENMRVAIKQVPDVVYTVREGKIITMSQQFSKVYSQDWE